MKNKAIAYFLWAIGGLGALGLHRFYLNKVGTGLLYFFTGGLGMIGSIYDLVKMDELVDRANYMLPQYSIPDYLDPRVIRELRQEAYRNDGIITYSVVDDITDGEAEEYMRYLQRREKVRIKVLEDGEIVYFMKRSW